MEFLPKILAKAHVHCGGEFFNNIGEPIPGRGDQISKIDFLSCFRFNLSLENSIGDGYVTEKLIQPMFTNTIPIYWGSDWAKYDFNPASFINLRDFESDDAAIEHILEIDSDKKKYDNILREPWFRDNKIPDTILPTNILKHIKDKILR